MLADCLFKALICQRCKDKLFLFVIVLRNIKKRNYGCAGAKERCGSLDGDQSLTAVMENVCKDETVERKEDRKRAHLPPIDYIEAHEELFFWLCLYLKL